MFLEEDCKTNCYSHHISQESCYQCDLWFILTICTWFEVMFVKFLHYKVSFCFFLPFSPLYLKGNYCTYPNLRKWSSEPTLKGMMSSYIIWIFFCIRDLFIYLITYLIHLLIRVWVHGYSFYALHYEFILPYLFCC